MNPVENEQICSSAALAILHGSGRLANVPGLIKRILKEEMWRERKVRTGKIVKLDSFCDLIVKKPLDGWGEDPAKVEAIIRDDPEVLAMWRDAMKEQGKRNDLVDNINEVRPKGTSREYTLSRLRSQHPKIFEEVKAGKLSANAAAIKAGFRKSPSIFDQLKKLWLKASPTERQQFEKFIRGS